MGTFGHDLHILCILHLLRRSPGFCLRHIQILLIELKILLECGGVSSGGLRELIPCIAQTAVAVGVDGIFMEVHNDPFNTPVDGPTQWPLRHLEELLVLLNCSHKTRLHIRQLVKDTSAKLKQASEIDHRVKVSTNKKITYVKLAKDFQAVLKGFQKAQRLVAERETSYTPFVPQTVLPSRRISESMLAGRMTF